VTLYWLKESILKNWLLGFLPHEGFPGYILCSVIVYLSVILLHAIVNECTWKGGVNFHRELIPYLDSTGPENQKRLAGPELNVSQAGR
jgi:hypothetical protein